MHPPVPLWLETRSGLAIPHQAPEYLFRGECGQFPTTKAPINRRSTYALRDGTRLTDTDLKTLEELIPLLVKRFTEADYSLGEHDAIGLLQHYGLPTWIIDFSSSFEHAATFAATGDETSGRICVFPTRSYNRTFALVNLTGHAWAERPRRQEAFGLVIAPTGVVDLKAPDARRFLGVQWFEFPISVIDRDFFRKKYDRLVSIVDDPSAGFLRFHITEYVEARDKVSPLLTKWLLEQIPVAPRVHRVVAFEADQVVVNNLPASSLDRDFSDDIERSRSEKYWSKAYSDSSWDRMRNWSWPPVGSVFADPRTFHGDIF
jgi:FRG domain